MTVFEFLKSKSIYELAKYLDEYGSHDNSPWMQWFNENYCSKCDGVLHNGLEYAYCELNDECRYLPDMIFAPYIEDIIKLWLESEID